MLTRLTLSQLPLLGDLSEETKQLLPKPTLTPTHARLRLGEQHLKLALDNPDIKSQSQWV